MKGKASETASILASLLSGIGSVEFAYLFGSVSRGDASPLSDIDVAVYMSEKPSLATELELHSNICRRLKTDGVHLVVLNAVVNLMLLDEIVRHGRVVFDRSPGLRASFEVRVVHGAIDFRHQRKVFAER